MPVILSRARSKTSPVRWIANRRPRPHQRAARVLDARAPNAASATLLKQTTRSRATAEGSSPRARPFGRRTSNSVPAVTDVRTLPARTCSVRQPSAVSRQPPAASTLRTDEPIRPPEPLEVVQAVVTNAEPRLQFTHKPRVVDARARGGRPRSRTSPVRWIAHSGQVQPVSPTRPTASMPASAARSSLSELSPDTPTAPSSSPLPSRTRTPPGTGMSAPPKAPFAAAMK